MTERPSSDDRDAPRPEVSAFLHDRATSLDREAAPVSADEAARRTIVDASTPRRQWPVSLRPSKVRTSPRSALAAAAVIALIVGALGGFALGRGSAPKHATVATAAANAPAADSAGGTTTVPSQTLEKVTSMAPGMPGGVPMTRVFDRTTSEGIDLHAFLQDQGQFLQVMPTCAPGAECAVASATTGSGVTAPECPANSWCPPPECYASSFVVEAANDGAVGQSYSSAYPLHDVAMVTSSVMFGDAEGSPARGWVVRSNEQVARVEATWSDGFVDSMAPSQGWAVVAHNGTGSATITALDGSGAAVATLPGDGNSYMQTPSECIPPPPPPPALPPAGAEQPDDPGAARQAITDTYQTVFTHGSDATLNATLIENPEGIEDAVAATRSNFPEAVDTVTVTVGDIVFTSKTEAALYFELKYTGGALFGQQVGYAKFIDGTWKISHDTMCMVLGWGGGMCDGGASGSSPGAPPVTPMTTAPSN
ncbi:MAG TPA: hypothetical protein VHI95_10260 [Acidimicrobiales bacterium]|jgi:hypothetical protein|nr:hypothetical protein [Acidimicrobiales bacterium]